MSEVATGWVTLAPSAKGFGSKLNAQIGGQVDGSGKRAGGLFGKAFGAAAGVGAGLAVAGFVKNAVGLEAEFSQTMNTIGAVANVPKKQLKDLSDLALDMGAKTVFSASEAGNAMLELAKGGLSAATIQSGALEGTLTLAAAGGTDMATAATIASNALNTFSLKGKDMGAVAAALAGGANASSASVESLGEALSQVGPGASTAGLNLQETVAVLSAFDAAGIKGSDAGTSLKTMLTRLVPTTTKAKNAMRDLGIDFTNADGSFKSITEISQILQDKLSGLTDEQRTTALSTIFGSDATRAATVLMKQGADGIGKFIKATNDQNAAQRIAESRMKGTAGAIENFKGSVETATLRFGQFVAPAVVKGLNLMTTIVNGIPGAFEAVGRAVSPVVSGVKKVATAFSVLFHDDGVAAFAEIMDNALGNTGQFIGLFRTVGQAIVDTVADLRSFLPVIQQAAGQILPVMADTFRNVLLPAIVGFVSYVGTSLWPIFQQIVGIVRDQVIPIIVSLATFFYGTLYPAVIQIVSAVAQNLKPVFDALVQTFQSSVLPTLQDLLKKFHEWQPTIEKVVVVVLKITGKILEFAAAILGTVLPVAIKFAGWLLQILVPAIATVIGWVVNIIGHLIDFGGAVGDAAGDVVAFAGKVKDKIGDVVGFFTELPGKVKGVFSGAKDWLVQAGKDVINGLIQGLDDAKDWLIAKAKSIAASLPGWVKKVLGIHSPSTVMAEIGRFAVAGFRKGLEDGEKAEDKRIKASIDRLKSKLTDLLSARDSLASSVSSAFTVDLFGGNLAELVSAGKSSVDNLEHAQEAFDALQKRGASKDFLSQLFQSGNTALAVELANASDAQLQQAEHLFEKQNDLAATLGSDVASNEFSNRIDGVRTSIEDLRNDLRNHPKETADALASALDRFASEIIRKRKKK